MNRSLEHEWEINNPTLINRTYMGPDGTVLGIFRHTPGTFRLEGRKWTYIVSAVFFNPRLNLLESSSFRGQANVKLYISGTKRCNIGTNASLAISELSLGAKLHRDLHKLLTYVGVDNILRDLTPHMNSDVCQPVLSNLSHAFRLKPRYYRDLHDNLVADFSYTFMDRYVIPVSGRDIHCTYKTRWGKEVIGALQYEALKLGYL